MICSPVPTIVYREDEDDESPVLGWRNAFGAWTLKNGITTKQSDENVWDQGWVA